MPNGTVRDFSEKGYGFISQEDGPDVFVHHTDIQMDGFRKLVVGQRVQFETEQGAKGLKAKNVIVLSGGGGNDSETARKPRRRDSDRRRDQ